MCGTHIHILLTRVEASCWRCLQGMYASVLQATHVHCVWLHTLPAWHNAIIRNFARQDVDATFLWEGAAMQQQQLRQSHMSYVGVFLLVAAVLHQPYTRFQKLTMVWALQQCQFCVVQRTVCVALHYGESVRGHTFACVKTLLLLFHGLLAQKPGWHGVDTIQ